MKEIRTYLYTGVKIKRPTLSSRKRSELYANIFNKLSKSQEKRREDSSSVPMKSVYMLI